MFLADGGKSVRAVLDPVKEPFRPEMEPYSQAKELGTYDMWQLQLERTELCKQYLDRWNACKGLDGLLCPTTPYASVEHGKFRHVGYTGVFNILDYSVVSFPCGVNADKEVDKLEPGFSALSDTDADVQKDCQSRLFQLLGMGTRSMLTQLSCRQSGNRTCNACELTDRRAETGGREGLEDDRGNPQTSRLRGVVQLCKDEMRWRVCAPYNTSRRFTSTKRVTAPKITEHPSSLISSTSKAGVLHSCIPPMKQSETFSFPVYHQLLQAHSTKLVRWQQSERALLGVETLFLSYDTKSQSKCSYTSTAPTLGSTDGLGCDESRTGKVRFTRSLQHPKPDGQRDSFQRSPSQYVRLETYPSGLVLRCDPRPMLELINPLTHQYL